MKALRRLTVRASFPEQLTPLAEIVDNLRWSWHPESLDLLESVDPELWRTCNHDPGRMLGDLGGHDLHELLGCFAAADAEPGRPTVLFAYTMKGWRLPFAGDDVGDGINLPSSPSTSVAIANSAAPRNAG